MTEAFQMQHPNIECRDAPTPDKKLNSVSDSDTENSDKEAPSSNARSGNYELQNDVIHNRLSELRCT
jgi:hypothetical protein